jgi:hypothetical protein
LIISLVRQEVANIQDDPWEEEDMEDDEGVQEEKGIWQGTHVCEACNSLTL